MPIFNEEKIKKFIKNTKIHKEVKKYNIFLDNFREIVAQYSSVSESYNNLLILKNNNRVNLKYRINKWFLAKKIQLLKLRMNWVTRKLSFTQRNVQFKILSLYFDDNSLKGKRLYSFEYEEWAKLVMEEFKTNDAEIKTLKDIIKSLFSEIARDKNFKQDHQLAVIEVADVLGKFVYEIINNKEILNFQRVFDNHKLITKKYNDLLKEIDLKIKTMRDEISKNNIQSQKISKIWFYKIWKCRQIKKNNKRLEIKIGEKCREKESFLKKLENFHTKSLIPRVKKTKLDLSAKLLTFYLKQTKSKKLKFSEYEVWKTGFIATCQKLIKNNEFDDLKVMWICNIAETLFKDVLENIKLQQKLRIEVINDDNNDLSSPQLSFSEHLNSDTTLTSWNNDFSEIVILNKNITYSTPRQIPVI